MRFTIHKNDDLEAWDILDEGAAKIATVYEERWAHVVRFILEFEYDLGNLKEIHGVTS